MKINLYAKVYSHLGGGVGGESFLIGSAGAVTFASSVVSTFWLEATDSRCGGGGMAPKLFSNFFAWGRCIGRKSFCNESRCGVLVTYCFGLDAPESRIVIIPPSCNELSPFRGNGRTARSSSLLSVVTGVIRNGFGCKISGLQTTACAVRCISKFTGFGPGLDTFDVGDSVNLVHSLLLWLVHSFEWLALLDFVGDTSRSLVGEFELVLLLLPVLLAAIADDIKWLLLPCGKLFDLILIRLLSKDKFCMSFVMDGSLSSSNWSRLPSAGCVDS